MRNEYEYHGIIRKIVAMFGDIFNEINVARKDNDGNLVNQRRVPLAYAPRESFLARLNERPDLQDERMAISLPRMSFEIAGSLNYDSGRQLPKNNVCRVINSEGVPVKVYAPAAYTMPMTLSIYGKNQNESLQILEQILPYFKPSIHRIYRPIDGETFTDQITFTLNSTTIDDSYDNDFTNNRKIIYTLNFEVRFNIFGNIDDKSKVIKTSIVNFIDSPSNDDLLTINSAVNPSTVDDENEEHTIDITYNYGFE